MFHLTQVNFLKSGKVELQEHQYNVTVYLKKRRRSCDCATSGDKILMHNFKDLYNYSGKQHVLVTMTASKRLAALVP